MNRRSIERRIAAFFILLFHRQKKNIQIPNAVINAGKGFCILVAAKNAPVEIQQVSKKYTVVFITMNI